MMKKPTLRIEEPQVRNMQRADIATVNGYAMVGISKPNFRKTLPPKRWQESC
jgi:hypothetical protein